MKERIKMNEIMKESRKEWMKEWEKRLINNKIMFIIIYSFYLNWGFGGGVPNSC